MKAREAAAARANNNQAEGAPPSGININTSPSPPPPSSLKEDSTLSEKDSDSPGLLNDEEERARWEQRWSDTSIAKLILS